MCHNFAVYDRRYVTEQTRRNIFKHITFSIDTFVLQRLRCSLVLTLLSRNHLVESKMHKLPTSFALLTYSGYWRPIKWPARSVKYWLYNIYSAFMIFLLYSFTFCALVDSATSNNLATMMDKFSLFISIFGVCLKVANLFLRREQIIAVLDSLLNEHCTPKNEQEAIIQRKFDSYARKLTIFCEILNESSASIITVAQLHTYVKTRTLPVSDWVPYQLSSKIVYCMTLLHQTIALMMCANASVANETLIAGMMIQASAQFEIFCYRARSLHVSLMEAKRKSMTITEFRNEKKRIFKELVLHHLAIYNFAKTVNLIFQHMIFIQFAISSSILCLIIYKTSAVESFNIEIVSNLCYLCSMLMQVYLYCWFGNEVTLQSEKVGEAIYDMDWTMLPVDMMKDLLIIMARSTKPVKMTSIQVITLSTDSFMSIMKITYSSYNILKDSSN